MARVLVYVLASSVMACAAITGLGDYEIAQDAPAPVTDGGGGAVTLEGGISLSTTSLAFGEARCGETKTLPIMITNAGASAVPLEVTPPPGVGIEGAAPSVPAGGSVTLRVSTTSTENGTLTVRVGSQSLAVAFSSTFHGPKLALGSSVLDFGELRHDTVSPPQSLALTNDGDEDLGLSALEPGGDFVLAAPVRVPAHGTASASITMTAGPAGDPITTSARLTADKPTCNGSPSVVLKGRRSPTDVVVDPTRVELVCTVGAPPPPVTVKNYGGRPVSLQAKFQAPLTVSPTPTNLGPGSPGNPSMLQLNSFINSTQAGDYAYDLSISEGDLPPRTVRIDIKLIGAYLQIDNAAVPLKPGGSAAKPATNTGNVPVCFHYEVKNPGGADQLPQLEADEQFDPGVGGDVKLSVPPNYSKSLTRIHLNNVACKGKPSPAPLCNAGSIDDLEFQLQP
ncbi:MAG: hypothetical protein U0270_25550 [Labilithrix sp.]